MTFFIIEGNEQASAVLHSALAQRGTDLLTERERRYDMTFFIIEGNEQASAVLHSALAQRGTNLLREREREREEV